MICTAHILLGCLLVQAAEAVPEDRPSEDLRIEFTTTAWFPRLIGTYSIGPGGTSLDVETDTYLHASEVAFNGELDFRFDEWTVRVLGTEFSTSGSGQLEESARVAGTRLPVGASWASDYSQWSVAAAADFALWRPFADEPFPWSNESTSAGNRDREGDYLVDLRLSPRFGFQYMHIRQTFDSASAGLGYRFDGGLGAILLGLLVEVEIDTRPLIPWLHELSIEAGATASPMVAGGSGYLYSIEATLRGYFTPNVALAFGFRLQGTSFTAEEYQREGSVMGLVGGASFRF